MAYLPGARSQVELFPASIEDYVGVDNVVRVYDAFVDHLDLKALGVEWNEFEVGAPSYEPRAMLKLLVYGTAYGIRSARKLERAVHHDVSFMWLMGGLKPDFKTIAEFRRKHRDALRLVFRQCVRFCVKLGVVEGNTLFVDGTKIRANAGMKQSWSAERCRQVLQQADERIEAILKECDRQDRADGEGSSLVHLQEELHDKKALKEKVQRIIGELHQSAAPIFNTTDPDCRHMQSRQGPHASYNVQMVVDDKHGLIVQSDVVNEVNDVHQLSPQVNGATNAMGKPCAVICADMGYDHRGEIQTVEDQGVTTLVPVTPQGKDSEGPCAAKNFRYESESDRYICPMGQELKCRALKQTDGERVYQVSDGSVCRRCEYWGLCTRGTLGRTITRTPWDAIKSRRRDFHESAEGQAIYRRRQMRAEHPFGHIKRNLGVSAFMLRGFKGVRAEAAILFTCFNLARLISLFGIQGLIQQFKTI